MVFKCVLRPGTAAFQESEAQEVAPFYTITSAGTYTVNAADMVVPPDWDVRTAGTVGTSNITAFQFQIASATEDAAYEFCLSNVTIN